MRDNTFELWLLATCLSLIVVWFVAEVVAASGMRRRRRAREAYTRYLHMIDQKHLPRQ